MRINGFKEVSAWLGKGAAALADQGLVAGSGLLVNVLLARWLTPEHYGAYTVTFSIFLLVAGFHNALVLEPMQVFGPSSYRSHLRAYLGKLVPLHFVTCLLLIGLLGFGTAISRHWLGSVTFLASAFWGLSLGAPCILFFWLWRHAAYLDLRAEIAMRGAAVYALLAFMLMLVFHRLGWLSLFGAFVLQAAAALAASALLMVFIRPQLSPRASPISTPSILRRHWEYGRWVAVTAVVYWLSGNASYVIAGFLLNMEDVAGLRALQTLVLPVGNFTTALSQLLIPWASARFGDRNIPAIQRAVGRATLLFTSAAFLYLASVWLCRRWLIALVYGGRYIEFSYLLPFLALPVLFTAASQGPAIALRAMRHPFELSLANTVAGIVNILAGVILTHYWGVLGTVMGMSSSYLAFLVVISHRYNTRLRQMLPRESQLPEFGPPAVRTES